MEKRTKEQMREKDRRIYWADPVKARAQNNAWAAANREKLKAKKDAYRAKPENKEKERIRRRAYYLAHKEQEREYNQKWSQENAAKRAARAKEREKDPLVAEKIKQRRKAYYRNNREARLCQTKQWHEANKERQRKYRQDFIAKDPNAYYNRRRAWKADKINLKIADRIRGRIRSAIVRKGASKSAKSFELVGCSIGELMKHLESCFLEGMSWDNYGLHGWHVDHRKPCATFDLTIPEQQRACFHYTNLQPLWAVDNWKKGKRISADSLRADTSTLTID